MASNDFSKKNHLASRHSKDESIDPSSNSKNLVVRFWGVRGSYPVPGPHTVKYGGNTSCVEISNSHHRVILDAGTGLIALGTSIMAEYRKRRQSFPQHNSHHLSLTLLLSHTHHDHIQALPFFEPAYFRDTFLHVYGPQLLGVDLRDSISQTMTARFCPVSLNELNSHKIIENLNDTDRLVFRDSTSKPELYDAQQVLPKQQSHDLVISTMRSYAHPKDGVFVFKLTNNGHSVVYATDIEGYAGGDSRLISFTKGADVLIHDAQYTHDEYSNSDAPKQGYGHSTVDMACEVAKKAGVGQLILFHHDPLHSDTNIDRMQEQACAIFPNTVAAYEGMEIKLGS